MKILELGLIDSNAQTRIAPRSVNIDDLGNKLEKFFHFTCDGLLCVLIGAVNLGQQRG